jgi:iron complex transport system substrate-binding protein
LISRLLCGGVAGEVENAYRQSQIVRRDGARYVEHMTPQRIVSFLPSATEMICALGLQDNLKGITHECDYPAEVTNKPAVVRPALPIENMTLAEIDAAVAEIIGNGQGLYRVDGERLREIAPDLIVTQNLCEVCAPAGKEISQALQALPIPPKILWLTPKSIEGIFQNLIELGDATDRRDKAEEVVASCRRRFERLRTAVSKIRERPRVFCMEWVDPVYCCGHWVPEMVDLAGGIDVLGRIGSDSVRIGWEDVVKSRPDVLVVMPCGFKLAAAAEQARSLARYPGLSELPAFQTGRVYAVDANSYFARPGPRIVEGTELLAHVLQPDSIGWEGPSDAYQKIDFQQ